MFDFMAHFLNLGNIFRCVLIIFNHKLKVSFFFRLPSCFINYSENSCINKQWKSYHSQHKQIVYYFDVKRFKLHWDFIKGNRQHNKNSGNFPKSFPLLFVYGTFYINRHFLISKNIGIKAKMFTHMLINKKWVGYI